MKVLVDGSALGTEYASGGVGRYLEDLMVGIREVNADAEVGFALPADYLQANATRLEGLEVMSLPDRLGPRGASLAAQTLVPWRSRRFDVLHSPVMSYDVGLPTVSMWTSAKQVAVVHDLIPLDLPDEYLGSQRRRLVYRATLRRLKDCALLLAVSGHTADALARQGVATRVRVVPNVTSRAGDGVPPAGNRAGFLAFSPHGPSKNPELLQGIADQMAAVGMEPLKIVGATTSLRNVHLLGRLSEKELRLTYETSEGVLITSTHEGFCLPAVEAREHGAPVVAFDAPWSRWLFPDGANLLPGDASAWIARLKDRSYLDHPGTVRSELVSRTRADLALDTIASWREATQ